MIEYFGSMKRCQTFAQRHFVLIFSALSSGQYDPLLSIVLTGGHTQYWLISRTARLPWRFPTTYNMAHTRLQCLSRSLFMLRSFYWKIRLKMSLGHSLHLETALPVSIAHHVLITHHAYGKIWSEDCVWTKCYKATIPSRMHSSATHTVHTLFIAIFLPHNFLHFTHPHAHKHHFSHTQTHSMTS